MKKWQKILQAMMETARAETAKGTDLRDVREAVRQTRDDTIVYYDTASRLRASRTAKTLRRTPP